MSLTDVPLNRVTKYVPQSEHDLTCHSFPEILLQPQTESWTLGSTWCLYVCKLNPGINSTQLKLWYEDCKRAGLCLIQKTFKSPADLYKWLRESAESFLPHPLLTRPSQTEPNSISLTYYPLTFCLQTCSTTLFVFCAAEGSDIINQLTLTENVKSQHGSLCRWNRTKTLVYSLNGRDDGRGAYVAVSLFA